MPERSDNASREIVAYQVGEASLPIVAGPRTRDWMSATGHSFANRCLPLLMANQSGWLILNDEPFTAVWMGGEGVESVMISPRSEEPLMVASHFGHGIITWTIPFLFQTPSGFNLLVRGPANHPKDAVCALEGVVETDWAPSTFTMSWKLTRPFTPVRFEEHEPICMIVPQRRGELEEFTPRIRPLASDERLQSRYEAWWKKRQRILRERRRGGPGIGGMVWQRDYYLGHDTDSGKPWRDHQMRLHIREFDTT